LTAVANTPADDGGSGDGDARWESFAQSALGGYDLPGPLSLRPLAFGLNATFEVRAGAARYVLRVHRAGYRTPTQIRSELEFVRAVGAELRGDPALPMPVPGRHGELVVAAEHQGERRSCDLLTWVDGRVLVPGDGLGVGGVRALGRALGRLHNAAATFRPPAGFEAPVWDADAMFDAAASPFRPALGIEDVLAPKDRGLFDEIADRTRVVFDALGRGTDAFGVTHIDFILGNCFLRRGRAGWNVSVFDFDDCGWGYFLYDLCPLLGNLAGYPGAIIGNPAYPRLRDEFLTGYRSARQLPVEWEKHLPLLIAARHANHCLLTARPDVSPTPADDAAWRMGMARRCLELPVQGLRQRPAGLDLAMKNSSSAT
jgi:Ser/Thr protein kinase RdoA (MazF antagonist)